MVDNTVANIWGDIIRTIYRLLDTVVYWLLGLMYQIFFNVASAELFTNETVKNFYGRVQLILGVFMIFKLAVSIVKGIVNPDTFVDKKEGMGNIIYRIMFALVMLTIIAPINIPNARNEYEIQLNNNGLLFGTLYSLQNRILSNNTLGKLILGTNDGVTVQVGNTNSGSQKQKLKEAADLFTSTILKGFIRINLSPDAASDDETQSGNWMCKDDLDEDTKQAYTGTTSEVPDPEVIIGLTSLKCDAPNAGPIAKILNSDQRYMFAYRGLISAIVGGVFVYILLNFTVDIAVRAIKLAILRLLAPIPIIAYIDPSGEKQAFSSWTKLLTSTYLDLFLRLAIIYFVIFLVQDITMNGLVMNQATGVVGILTYIFIFLGLFIFAKQAPKFIKQVFGMKDDGGKLFGGFGEALGMAAGFGAIGAAGVGSAITGWKATAASRSERGLNSSFMANAGGALVHGMSGTTSAFGAFAKAKDHHLKAVTDDSIARNNKHYNLFSQGASYAGMGNSRVRSVFGGDTAATKLERSAAAQKSFADYYKHATAKADSDSNWTNASGQTVKALKEEFERTKLSGASVAEQKRAEDAYKKAQAELITDVMQGRYTTGGQSEHIRAAYESASKIADSFVGTEYELTRFSDTADSWKLAQFDALDNEYNIKDSSQLKIAKANDSGAGVGGKK